ncbi:MAG: FAD binding domain-containing protein [Clostridia bacterium]|nr:FAD binding domain-containing protein [Clostridia bacterium]
MLTIDKYLRPATLEEAYEAAQKKNSVVLGGMLWLRLANKRVGTAIDLSGLGLDYVTETDSEWKIGAYTPLRTLETHEALNRMTDDVFRRAFSGIVGVQFRNLATAGGSVFGRFGFSDVITAMLALDASVVLYKTGVVTLEEFCQMGKVNDILTEIRIPKTPVRTSYFAQRNTATDFPVLNVCAAKKKDQITVAVGARPLCSMVYRFDAGETAEIIAGQIAGEAVFAGNTRASAEYRRHLCRVLVKRAVDEITAGKEEI